MSVKKKKRKLNGQFIALVCAVLLVGLSIYKIPHFINTNKLLDMGYSEDAVSAIYDKGLRKTILKNEYYSDYLNKEVVKDTFNDKYLRLYTMCDYLDENYFNLYEDLKAKKGYTDEELDTLFSSLKDYDLKPLYVFDKLEGETITDYIDDCLAHENSSDSFKVSGDYLHPYENVLTQEDLSAIDVYVSTKSTIGEYEPSKMVTIDEQFAVPNIYLQSIALDAFTTMASTMRSEGVPVYATGGYVSYSEQKELQAGGDSYTKAGYFDSQTGLAVYVVATASPTASAFKDTEAYAWLNEHAHEYGFILRFPEGKEEFTGHSAVYNYYRYVGKELATEIHDSGLSFDEYYFMYIK